MKMQIGEVVMGTVGQRFPIKNKTLKYLTPCLKKYGGEFEKMYNSVFKIAIGIGDLLIQDEESRFEQHIFILLDSRVNRMHFLKFLAWMQDFEYFEDDYVHGDIQKSPYHMVIFKLPEECMQSFEKFTKGKYSEMYSLEDVNRLFKEHALTKRVLLRDKDYKVVFIDKLNKRFNTTITNSEYDGELDLPPRKEEEYFE